jgi:hypothetical protein
VGMPAVRLATASGIAPVHRMGAKIESTLAKCKNRPRWWPLYKERDTNTLMIGWRTQTPITYHLNHCDT